MNNCYDRQTITDSILFSVQKMIGVEEPCENNAFFSPDIVMHINSVLAGLVQMGVGPSTGFEVVDETQLWTDFLGEVESPDLYNMIKTYVGLKVRLLFDPPANSNLTAAIEKQIAEYEWRLYIQADTERIDKEKAKKA